MRVAGYYPDLRRANQMVSLQAEPHTYPSPPMGDPEPLVWRTDETEDGYAAAGRTLAELKELGDG